MHEKKNEAGTLLPMVVTAGVTVNVLPNEQHEYLMSTREVANGYGTSEYVVRRHKLEHSAELLEGRHFVKGVSISHTPANAQPHQVFWTKAGIIRLGFFIRSERARLFRDWAENLVLTATEQRYLPTVKQLPKKRNHNRLTSERLIRLLQLTHRIENAELRNEIVEQLMGGNA